jgi:hypothetical protein
VCISWDGKELVIKSNDSSQDIVARFAIYASLHAEISHGQLYNASDNAIPGSWSQKWPIICEYFGLIGTAPPKGNSGPQPGKYIEEHLDEWKTLEKEKGLQMGRVGNERSFGGFQYFIMTMFDFDRQLSLEKMHKAWGKETEETDVKGRGGRLLRGLGRRRLFHRRTTSIQLKISRHPALF